MPTVAVARITVEFLVDADTLRDAEKTINAWLSPAEDDDRLIEYRVNWERSDWEPRFVEDAATTLEP